ncbi:MAG TPA: site-2 protease family protein [Janthinobacterium sp.]|jgi:Zn-dependent protease|nr:site-2 protease family protein [Janthinobacterium sp.]
MNDIDHLIQTILICIIPVLFAVTLHEVAHGFTAKYFGDPTAFSAGRLSLNPIRHIDPFGSVLLPLLLFWSIGIPFGYAKPVPVDFSRLRNPRKQSGLVALAGPGANFFMGLGWMIADVLMRGLGVTEPFFLGMADAGISINAAMMVFNLIPIPPLDGGRIVTSILPIAVARKYARIELYGMYVFIALVALMYFHVLDGMLKWAIGVVINLFYTLVSPLTFLLS